ncbi:DUF1212-domain-containing protein [Aspergillus steynii IBT 23096]|uniref:DUF1212-domain-containing protein n=1 Tax=Aspergillus steynii IBT 23096 TaxID=1392250 RepID=A0A2I2FW44_9EURO|nr:DUF1212-domain-containing protein [Aspergillus steynii IBT 23096]PLB44848.1 DUF1212-domain-containing protein [Aspergillus steynii IBT 23096]
MSEPRRASQISQSSLISYRSVASSPSPEDVDSPPRQNSPQTPPQGSPHPRSPPVHRVHFGSDMRFEYGDTEDTEDTEQETQEGGEDRFDEKYEDDDEGEPASGGSHPRQGSLVWQTELPQREMPSETGRGRRASFLAKVSGIRHSVVDRTRQIAAKLGRPPGDDEDAMMKSTTSLVGSETPRSETTSQGQSSTSSEAHRLVREMTHEQIHRNSAHHLGHPNHQNEDPELSAFAGGGGILSHLLRLSTTANAVDNQRSLSSTSPGTPALLSGSTPGTGTMTPRKEKPKWYRKQQQQNTSTPTLIPMANSTIPSMNVSGASTPVSSEVLTAASKRRSKHSSGAMRLEDEIQVTLQIAQIIARQRYIMQLCKALMRFGAPTHRLEEYMHMTAKALGVESQYLYVPGCMIMSFDDAATRTAEVKLVRVVQGVDLGRLADTHNVYKNVVHDVYGIEEAIHELEEIMNKSPRFNKWIIVFVYGLATAMVGPFAFNARPIDMPVIFFNGCLLGVMQHVIAPRSVLYSNVFEVSASVLTSFIARALGSIITSWPKGSPDRLFCFSAIAQSSIALILPGYTVLCSSLELQSHQIVAGSIRMVYAIIYSLFLGFGITVGTTIYGLIDRAATSDTTCPTAGAFPDPYLQRFPFVVAFSLCLMIVNQGKWKQSPVMVIIALAGYVTNYFVTKRLGTTSQVANTVGAFTIGVIGNLYSRLWHGHAAAAILPGIFVLVPSGLAATGSLVTGVETADETRSNATGHGQNQAQGTGSTHDMSVQVLGYGMVQVAIGITVGLFVAALVVYPFGKRRSGLFSF